MKLYVRENLNSKTYIIIIIITKHERNVKRPPHCVYSSHNRIGAARACAVFWRSLLTASNAHLLKNKKSLVTTHQ